MLEIARNLRIIADIVTYRGLSHTPAKRPAGGSQATGKLYR